MIDSTGEHTVACVTDDGVEVPGFTVLAIDVQIAAARAEGAMRGVTSEASFTLDASIPLPRRVWVEAPAGFLVDTPRAGATPGQWTVSVHPDQDAPAEASLRVMAEAGGTEVELGEIPVAVAEPSSTSPVTPETSPEPRGPERHMFELGVWGGVMLPSSNHDLFQERFSNVPGITLVEHQALRRAAPDLGIRLGYYPIRWVGVELEHALVPTRTRDTGDRATVFAIRGQVLGQLPWRVTPTVHLGGGALGVSAGQVLGRDIDRALHFGVGVKAYLVRWAALRLDLRDVITEGHSGGAAHSPEILVGVAGVIGRRSAASPTGRRLRPARP